MKTIIPLLGLGLSIQLTAFGWGNPGHMAIAGIAYDELSPTDRSKIVAILKHHPDLNPIKLGFPTKQIDDRSFFMAAATWPDLIRGDSHYTENPHDAYEEKEPAVTRVTYQDHLKHRGWHFRDTYFHLDAATDPLPPVPAVNAVNVVNVLVSQVGSSEPDVEKGYDLMWLFHLVGDLHQPLHAVSGVSASLPKGDHGGNFVRVTGAPGASELHELWDELPGQSSKPDPKTHLHQLDKDVATANAFISTLGSVTLGADSNNLNPAKWADESYRIATADGYHLKLTPAMDSNSKPIYKAVVDDSYMKRAKEDAKSRVKLAGHRLALLLKNVAQ